MINQILTGGTSNLFSSPHWQLFTIYDHEIFTLFERSSHYCWKFRCEFNAIKNALAIKPSVYIIGPLLHDGQKAVGREMRDGGNAIYARRIKWSDREILSTTEWRRGATKLAITRWPLCLNQQQRHREWKLARKMKIEGKTEKQCERVLTEFFVWRKATKVKEGTQN